MTESLVLGWDPSIKGAAWARLRISGRMREFVDCGECEGERDIGEFLRSCKTGKVTLVGVEVPQGIHTEKDDAKTARARGTMLMKTRGVAASIATMARMLGFDVLELSPDQCRSQIGMRRSPSDKAIAQALRILVPNWPKRTNNHNRDAAVCALSAEMRWPLHKAQARASGWM